LLAGAHGDPAAIRLIGSFTGYALVGFIVAYSSAILFSVLSEVPLVGASTRRFVSHADEVVRVYLAETVPACVRICGPSHPRAPPALYTC
jgi:hypothetical protein